MDWKFIILSGGPIVLILFVILILVIIIIIERILYYKNYINFITSFEEKLNSQKNISTQEILDSFYNSKKILSINWITFIKQLQEPENINNFEEIFYQFYNKEILHLEKYLIFLATMGNLSPFIGLLGTVFGIIRSFMHLGETNMTEINRGIAEALIATAIGLIVAIPSSFSFNYFRKTIEKIELQLEVIKSALKLKIYYEKKS
ncbi:MAG: MotA/TolQ/ExbB proton channel family protein [Leptospiraceae bacterium]|jgi:biopolymer transport protein ExbB/TolQ|nr:MotA/TolQ/ExbB proton channel family protein [Leptospiraceae bacterium]